MKNVAATSGQKVSLGAVFLAVGRMREGGWAGSDKALNFCCRPPEAIPAQDRPLRRPRSRSAAWRPHLAWSEFACAEYKSWPRMQEENGGKQVFPCAPPAKQASPVPVFFRLPAHKPRVMLPDSQEASCIGHFDSESRFSAVWRRLPSAHSNPRSL